MSRRWSRRVAMAQVLLSRGRVAADRVFAQECVQKRQICSVGGSPTGGKVRNLRSLGRIRGGNEADEADRQSHHEDGERVGLEMPILALNRGFGNVAHRQTSTLR